MADNTVVYADIVKSTTSSLQSIDEVLNLVGQMPQTSSYFNTWGDAFIAVFDKSEAAVRYALNLRDRLRMFDWRHVGCHRPPLLRTAIAAGAVGWKSGALNDRIVPEGGVLVEAARIEPITGPGEVRVTETVKALAGVRDFFYEDMGEVKLAKASGNAHLYRAYWSEERVAITEGRRGPLRDDQYYRRFEALSRFALLWMLLDQLPIGSWGRSVAPWMEQVWRGIPNLASNPLMEDEGGFETTVLNLELLSEVLGPIRLLQTVGGHALEYLQQRQTGKGFGTIGIARQGYAVEARPRHTALAAWLLGSVLKDEALSDSNLRALFRTGALALLGGNPGVTADEFATDRNPLMLYLAAWHVVEQIKSPEWAVHFSDKEISQMTNTWASSKDRLLQRALKRSYTRGLPEHLARGRVIFPLTIPYAEFVRMESYSLLSAATLVDPGMPKDILERVKQGIRYLAHDYLQTCSFGRPEVRYSRNPLQPRHRGVRPYLAKDDSGHVDLGTTAMLIRALRSPKISKALWTDLDEKDIWELGRARYFLMEDLTELFDRYLIDPGLYAFSHAGMLAAIMDGDSEDLRHQMVARCAQVLEDPPSTELWDDTLDDILSEHRLGALVQEIVENDDLSPKIQLSTISLTRLLLDKVRPGRYVTEKLSPSGLRIVSTQTIEVYRKPEFAEKYTETWSSRPDLTIVAPFIQMLPSASNILDVGCGPGHYAVQFSKAGHHVALLDCSSSFLDIASQALKAVGCNPLSIFNCNVLDERNLDTVVRKGPYDAIWCAGLFVHIPASARHQLLGWFKELLTPAGVLFVNIMVDNPRLFAMDGRFYVYDAGSRDFLTVLSQCGFRSDYVVQRTVRANTYGEPFLETYWVNYYASQIQHEAALSPVSPETFLTTLAYESSVKDFRRIHDEANYNARIAFVHRLLDEIAAKTVKNKPRVLDAGCGLGDFVIEAARRGWEAVGVDISEKMVCDARESCRSNQESLASFFVCDIRCLPSAVTNQPFDAVFCVTALQHIPQKDLRTVLAEFARVLRSSGILRVDIRVGEKEGYDPDLRFIQSFPDAEPVIAMAKQTGFRLLEQHPFETSVGANTFKRPLGFKFIELWFIKES